jgi:hypothetical protein
MRTLKLTHEQIAIVQQALGIAEKKFSDIHEDIIKNTVTVRGVDSQSLKSKQHDIYFNESVKFCDINLAIEDRSFDV